MQRTRRSLPPDEWDARVSTVFKFIHQCTSILYNKVEASDICLRLYLLALAAADESGHEELAYEFAVQAFTIYEESISESRAQLQAIAAIIGALQVTRVFGDDNYDTLITKAALHGAKLLKKGQQATAVAMASHLWWQMDVPGREPGEDDKVRRRRSPLLSALALDSLEQRADSLNSSAFPQPPYRDGKRVLECLQKALRIATSSIDELTSVQLYCDALDQYLYYFEHGVESISAKHINSLVELISSNLDSLPPPPAGAPSPNPSSQQRGGPAPHTAYAPSTIGGATSGLIEGVNTPEAVARHFLATLRYIHSRKDGANEATTEDIMRLYEDVDVAGVLLKLGQAQGEPQGQSFGGQPLR